MDNATKVKILQEATAELMRHGLDTFVEGGVSVALGGNGVVVTG
jgi:ribulose-5-phosphate 4-epimerase/fuculose-1-phosphate aldolase